MHVCAWYAGELTKEKGSIIGEVVQPVAPDVDLFGGGEGVLDAVLVQRIVECLGAGKKGVGLTAGDVEELQFLVGGGGIGEQILVLRLHAIGSDATAPAGGAAGVAAVGMVQTND